MWLLGCSIRVSVVGCGVHCSAVSSGDAAIRLNWCCKPDTLATSRLHVVGGQHTANDLGFISKEPEGADILSSVGGVFACTVHVDAACS